ncbi:MAG TPA: LpqB family beta-propeller domain-containing protein, partial [Candidatus Nanopelagicales bacterium]|nr:LpqB family beta-propeller domain-containing protein [Candidatus Nanopelagicales bacterium]
DTDIFLIRPDGTDKHALVSIEGEKEFAPSWSPSGQQIAFVSDMTGLDQVYVMNIDGTGMRQLTTSGANTDPAWSADGKHVYVTSTRTGNSDVVQVPVGKGKPVNLTKANTTRDLQPNSQPRR